MEKKNNYYKIHLEELSLKNSAEVLKSIDFEFVNHDDLFKIIEVLKSKNLFGNENDATEFALGIKLFSEVMLRHRDHPLFEELKPAFGEFMKKLKND
ncbi:protein of unknown function [Epilithonimonas bovis DSM 19482]|jgi:hypothetical protein|uniref:DUF3861 domain-containing protein n=1 Tax=Epilithonimonas bovis DSM 19482 TaxID=1121284 RepID=A0A1U7PW66_9FLAO|nr:DUF3861 domain-containing protein [Epilithonimonas bovis]MDN5627606.1 DUF3861 domain-containing protein [Weeksellaceae bacterium]QIY82449.1 DUF3861 domain-containing protein [Chryseobacterium sp. NEB161]SIT97129.1 protein of unknown function [Epilithonimonas bovis DSM 19482]